MTARTRGDLWRQLCDAGLAQGDLPEQAGSTSPWFVRAMLGVAGWIGALFLLGFLGVGLGVVFRNEAAILVVGALCCGVAIAIFARGGRNMLAAQFALAVSLAGQALFIYGLHETSGFDSESPVFFLMVMAFEGALAWYVNSFVHRVWSSFGAAVAFGYAMNMFGLYGAGSTLVGAALATVWLNEDEQAARGALWRAIGWGLVFAFVQPSSFLGDLGRWNRPVDPVFTGSWILWTKSILVAGVLIYVVYRLLQRYGAAPSSTTGAAALAASAVVGAATLRAPGVVSSLVIVLLGFAGGNRALSGFGIVALLSYLSYFYYSLQTTLLMKSMVLAGTGLALITLWLVMRSMFGGDEQEHSRA